MGKKKNRKFLTSVAEPPEYSTTYIDPKVARQLSIIFSFKHLDLDKDPFKVRTGDGDGMLYVLSCFSLFSKMNMQNLTSYPKCHPIPDSQVAYHNLKDIVAKSPHGKLHQLGRNQTPERIIGYFDSSISNLFQVCLLDLHHKLSGD